MFHNPIRAATVAVMLALTPIAAPVAQPTVQALIPTVLPLVEKARSDIVEHPTLAAYEIESKFREIVDKARAAFTGPQSGEAVRATLQPLATEIGPLRNLPYFQLHQLLGAVAGAEGRTDDQMYHRAFAVSLLIAVDRSGDGKTPQSAKRVVLLAEQYAWFGVNPNIERKSRATLQIEGRVYDVWTVASPEGERAMYFDVTAMFASTARIMAARQRTPPR